MAHNNLGMALLEQLRYKEAEAVLRQAIIINSAGYQAHINLGNALRHQGHREEAEAEYRIAIDIKPDEPIAYYNLGWVLMDMGRFREAQAACREALRNAPPGAPIRRKAEGLIRECDRLIELDRKLLAIQRKEIKPADAHECLELAEFCQFPYKRLYAAATEFYAEVFAGDPRLDESFRKGPRYAAACCAAQAAAGQGADAPKSDDKEQTRLRRLALQWLSADLGLWKKLAETSGRDDQAATQRAVQAFKNNPALSSVRNSQELAKLPKIEREAWENFWAEVERLRN